MGTERYLSGRARTLTFTLLVGLLLAGCGKGDGFKRVYLSGPVTFNGQPIANGMISFIPLPGTETPMTAEKIVNGQYETKMTGGVPVGKYRVEINSFGGPVAKKAGSDFLMPEMQAELPAKYNSESTLTLDLTTTTETKMEQPYHLTP